MKLLQSGLLISLIVCAVACNKPDEEITESKPKTVAFDGAPDAKYVGVWKSADNVSTYNFLSNGTYKLDSKIVVSKQAPFDSHTEGEWKVNGEQFLVKDTTGNVVPYNFTFKNNELHLSLTGSMKRETVLRQQ